MPDLLSSKYCATIPKLFLILFRVYLHCWFVEERKHSMLHELSPMHSERWLGRTISACLAFKEGDREDYGAWIDLGWVPRTTVSEEDKERGR